ncbi:MAG: SecD/SecF fusion protein, partial [Fimbriimonadaceae bacterium]|nr:SecD/SecF fusion protein [Fimbriimonadaceae bacterium]
MGLDVRGGVRFVYQIDKADLRGKTTAEVAPKILKVLQHRVSSALGVVEGNVSQKGYDQFIVELPGFTDEKAAAKTLGTSASIKFYHAKNLVTEQNRFRPYTDISGPDDP